MIEPYANVDAAVDDIANQHWKNITTAIISHNVELLYDNAISLKALEEAKKSVKKTLKNKK
jgi:hypothetical protein